MTNQLSILRTQIRQDTHGRYCLNDCHKASGSDVGKRPGEWLRNEQAQALVAELTDAGNPASPVSSVKGGLNQGTYVAKELVYAYAMWISPAFHLRVIRAFDGLMSVAARPLVPRTMAEALRLAADQAEALEQALPKVAALERITEAEGDLGVRDAGRELKIGQERVAEIVEARGWACRERGRLRPTHYARQHDYARLVCAPYKHPKTGEEMMNDTFKLTRKGVARIAFLIATGKA